MISPWRLLPLTITISQLSQQLILSFQARSSLTFNPRRALSLAQAKENMTEYKSPFHPIKIVGTCGSIGSGKSFASKLLVKKLNPGLDDPEKKFHIDTDALGHMVYLPNTSAAKEIEIEFGEDVIFEDGSVNRKALGAIVFADRQKMSKLEYIVWPHVKDLILKQLTKIQSSYMQSAESISPIVVVESAVLLDTNWDSDDLFDAIWVVSASEKTRSRRLVHYRNMTKSDALKRIEAQRDRRGVGNLKDEVRDGFVTAVIENNEDDEEKLCSEIKSKLTDDNSWKVDRRPVLDFSSGGGACS